jgi:hypothetical protein
MRERERYIQQQVIWVVSRENSVGANQVHHR